MTGTVRPSHFGDYFDFGISGTMVVATSGPSGYRPLRLLLGHQLYVKDVPKLLAEHPGQTGLVVIPVDDKTWIEVPPVPPVVPTWAHTPQNDPAGLYDDNWEPLTGSDPQAPEVGR
jgi:hypothetical protein